MHKAFLLSLALMSGHAAAAPLACLIEPDKVAEIGSPRIGIIEKVMVERGDRVKQGQIIARLKADVERASFELAKTRAQADADLHAAKASFELAKAKLARSQHLVNVGFISKEALDQADAEAKIAEHRVDQAQEAQRASRQELVLSNSQLDQLVIRSPFSGVIVDRFRTEGERIEREPIVRVAKIDPLRVEVILPSSSYGTVTPGTTINLTTEITGNRILPAKVVLVDRILDAASNTFRVRLSLPNPDHTIPAGLRCMAAFPTSAVAMDKPRTYPESAMRAAAPQPEPNFPPAGAMKLSYELNKLPAN